MMEFETQYARNLKKVETALQGTFPEQFVKFLYQQVKRRQIDDWETCTDRIATGLKKVEELVAGDFLEVLRDIDQEKAMKNAHWEPRAPAKGAPDWNRMAEKICADPTANDMSRSIARELAARKDVPPPPVTGGEKYRKSKKP